MEYVDVVKGVMAASYCEGRGYEGMAKEALERVKRFVKDEHAWYHYTLAFDFPRMWPKMKRRVEGGMTKEEKMVERIVREVREGMIAL